MSEILMLVVLLVLFGWGAYADVRFVKKVDEAKSICPTTTVVSKLQRKQ